jgi:hypothetical protein
MCYHPQLEVKIPLGLVTQFLSVTCHNLQRFCKVNQQRMLEEQEPLTEILILNRRTANIFRHLSEQTKQYKPRFERASNMPDVQTVYLSNSFIHSFHWHVENATILCHSQELLPFHPFPPIILPSSLTSSCYLFLGLCLSLIISKFIYNAVFRNSIFFHSLYMPEPT